MSILDAYKEMTGEDLSGRPPKNPRNAALTDAPEQGAQESNILTAFEDMQRERASLRQRPVAEDPVAESPAASARPEAIPTATETQPEVSWGDAMKREAGYLGSSLKRGWNTIVTAVAGSNLNSLEQMERDLFRFKSEEDFARDPELRASRDKLRARMLETAQTIRDVSKENEALLSSDQTRPETKLLYGVGKDDRGWLETAKDVGSAIISNPMSLVDLGLGSGPASLASAASAVAVTLSTKNPVAGATAGGMTSGYVEFGNEYAQHREAGLSHEEAWSKAARKASVVGLLDGVSMSTAGKALDTILDASKGAVAKTALTETVKETGRQAALGAAGEAGGSLLAGEPINPTNVILEAVGETVTAPIEAISTARGITGETAAAEARRDEVARRQAVRALDPNRDVTIDPMLTVRPADAPRTPATVQQPATAVAVVADPPEQPPENPQAQQVSQPAPAATNVAATQQITDPARAAMESSEDALIRNLEAQEAAQAAPAPEAPPTFVSAVESIKADLGVDATDALNLTEVTNDTRLNRFKNALESAFGVTVHWVDFGEQLTTASGKQLGAFSGYRKDNTILVGAKDVDFLDTTWHELTHVLETRYPDVYRALRDTVVPAMDPAVRDQLVQSLNQRRQQEVGRDMTAAELDSELVAYVVGDQVRNPQLLGQMFDSFEDPAVAKTFRDILTDILNKLLAVVKGPQYIRERARLIEAQKSITTAFAEFQKRETQKRMAAPVQPVAQAAAQPAARPARRNPFLDDEPPAPRAAPAGLPQDLAGAKPRYGMGPDNFDLDFESDLDKALFITSQANKSKRDGDYRAWLRDQGLTDPEIASGGRLVRNAVKTDVRMHQSLGKKDTPVTVRRTSARPGEIATSQAADEAAARVEREESGGQFKRKEKPAQDEARPETIPTDTNEQQKTAPQNRFRLDIKRAERVVDTAAGLSTDEMQAIRKSAIKLKVPVDVVNRLIEEAAATKARYPSSAGWEQLVATGLMVPKKKKPVDAQIRWQPSTYKFNVADGVGRAPQKVDVKWASKVSDEFYKLIKDIYARAAAGDANAQVILSHQNWYRNVTEVLRREFGATGDLLADLLGATSPNTPVDTNWKFSIDILRRFVRGDFNAELKKFAQYVDDGKPINEYPAKDKVRQISGKLYGMNSTNAMLAMLDTWRQIHPGQAPKARNFALNLIGQSEMATIDVWAARMLRRAANAAANGVLRRIPPPAEQGVTGTWNAKATAVSGEFGFGALVMEDVATRLRADGINVTAPDLQAIAWFAEKELWAKNNWTTAQGEGGSFEENIEKMPMERYLAGWSIQQGEKVPDSGAVSLAQARVMNTLARDNSVVAARVLPTKGLYGGTVEESFDTEWTVTRGEHDPSLVMAEIAQIAKDNNQYDIFVSKVLRPEESSANARPGVEIYFRDQKALDAAMPVLERFTSQGVDGFTMAVDPRAEGGNYVGVRLQFVPEISMRWDEQFRANTLTDGFIERVLEEKTSQLDDIADEVSRMDGVAFAKTYQYDTIVVGKENYDAFIDRGTARSNQASRNEVWFGQPIRAAVERAAARLNRDSGQVDAGRVPDADRAGTAAEEVATGGQFSRRNPQVNTPAFKAWFGDSKVVNESGQPKVMYHGTAFDIQAFEPGRFGLIFASPNPEVASSFASVVAENKAGFPEDIEAGTEDAVVYPVHVRATNPFDYEDSASVSKVIRGAGILPDSTTGRNLTREIGKGNYRAIEDTPIINSIKRLGFDGIYVKEFGVKNLAVFEPTQLKSAVGNNGNFDRNDPRTNFARRVPTQGQRFTLPERTARELTSNALRNRMSRVAAVQRAVVEQGGTTDLRDAQGNVVGDTDITRATEAMSNAAAARLEGFRDRTVLPLINDAAELGVNLDEVAQYLYALYAPERNAIIQQRNPTQFATDGGSGMTNAEAAAIVTQFRGRPDFQQIEQIAQRFKDITRMTQNVLLSEGLVDPVTIAQWRADNPNYVPLRGFEEVDENTGEPLKGGDNPGRLDPRNPFVKTAKGRESRAGDILENIFKDYEDAVVLAEKNLVYRRLLKFVQDNPDPKLWEVDATVQRRTYRKGALTLTGQTQGQVSVSYDIEKSPENTIAVRVKGRPVFIKINDPGMLDDLQMNMFRIDNEQAQKVFDAWQSANNMVKKTYTSLNPVFVVKELARSSEQVLLWNATKYGAKSGAGRAFKKLVKSAKAAYKAERDNNWAGNNDTITIREPGLPPRTISVKEAYEMFKADGGKTAFLDIRNVEDIREEIARRFELARAASSGDPRTYHKRVANALLSAEEAIIEFVSVTDNAFRFATYMARLEAGNTRQEAADAARNVTVNHAAKGKMTPLFGAAYMFFNPAVQGAENTFRAAFRTGWRGRVAVGSMIALGLMMAEMQSQMSGDDDEPYWDKDLYKQAKLRNIPIFNEEGDVALIPLLYGWGFFVNIGYAMHDMARGVPAAKVGAFIRDSFFTHFSPLGSLENPGTFFAPTMLDPVMVISNNKTDQGIPLMPDSPWNKGQPDSEKFWGSTRGTMFQQTARWLNEVSGGNPYESGYIDISPETMRYMVGFLTGGTGGFVRDASESIYLSTELGPGAAFDKNKIPLLKSFFVQNTGKADQVQFYRNADQATEALQKMNDLYGTEYETQPKVMQRLAERQFLAELGNAVGSFKDALGSLREQEVDIIERKAKGELTAQLAEEELKLINERKNELYIEFNREFYLVNPDTPK